MVFFEIILVIAVCATVTRFVRQSEVTAGLRAAASGSSQFLAKMLSCQHCLSFWIAVVCTVVLRAIRDMSYLELGLFAILGWRGGYFVNRQLDKRAERRETGSASRLDSCAICGKDRDKDFFQRLGISFCSYTCWFDYLKRRPRPREDLRAPSGELIRLEVYPLSYKDVTPQEASRLMSEAGYSYVDVRSEPEFLNGHPSGALNIPIMFREAMGMVPNRDFLTVMQANFDLKTPLLLGCQSGGRSGRAAEALVAAGFTDVSNVLGGYGGASDEQGRVMEKGWLELGLSVDYGEPEGRTYAALTRG